MSFINIPIECTVCRGTGSIKPASVFAAHAALALRPCMNCGGKGMTENKVYINPVIEEPIKSEVTSIVIDEWPKEDIQETEEIFEEVKAIKAKKKSRKVELGDANK